MSGLYFLAVRAMHAALPSSLLVILTFDVDSWTPSNFKMTSSFKILNCEKVCLRIDEMWSIN